MRASFGALLLAGVLLFAGGAQADPPVLTLTDLGPTFSSPVYVASTPADPNALFVVEQTGTIQRVVAGVEDATPFLDIHKKISTGGERGLLSMAFSPNYGTDHFFFVYFTDKSGKVTVEQYVTRLGKDPKPVKKLLSVSHPSYDNHNGGQLQFGPDDGMLYAGLGDGGSGGDPKNNAQNPRQKLGKILRAAGPKFNKWIVAGYGVRNPWRYSFDSATGDLFIGEVGQNEWEEIDKRAAADLATPANYGWKRYEGTHDYDIGTALNPPDTPATPLVNPVYEYDHSNSNCAIVGGYVYHGTAMADESGRYFFTDLCTGVVQTIATDGTGARVENLAPVGTPSSFGVDADGELYICSLDDDSPQHNGKVYRFSE